MLSDKVIGFVVSECSLQQRRRLINLSKILGEKNQIIFLTEDEQLMKLVESSCVKTVFLKKSKNYYSLHNSLRIRDLFNEKKLDIVHFFGIQGLIESVPWVQKTNHTSLCFDFSPRKYPLWLKLLLSPFIKRFDRLFIPSKLSRDDVWLNLRVPPGRCTSLSLKDLSYEQNGQALFHLKEMSEIPSLIRVGIYLNSPVQFSIFFRLKNYFENKKISQKVKLCLIRDKFNETIFEEQHFRDVQVLRPTDDEYTKIDLWIVLGRPSDHPHLLRMFKNGAHLISPSTSYLMELKESMNEIISTYPHGDMRAAFDCVKEKSEQSRCRSYSFLVDLEEEELKRVIRGYERGLRRRELAKKVM